mmetsp:Transcript_28894/g.65341  ORF Transcript_28894/g.65341 Transcript_28894/m.65341 type:complete len:220 (-) Transcript_28894:468-1127(-)
MPLELSLHKLGLLTCRVYDAEAEEGWPAPGSGRTRCCCGRSCDERLTGLRGVLGVGSAERLHAPAGTVAHVGGASCQPHGLAVLHVAALRAAQRLARLLQARVREAQGFSGSLASIRVGDRILADVCTFALGYLLVQGRLSQQDEASHLSNDVARLAVQLHPGALPVANHVATLPLQAKDLRGQVLDLPYVDGAVEDDLPGELLLGELHGWRTRVVLLE